jgi:hypothetical protein
MDIYVLKKDGTFEGEHYSSIDAFRRLEDAKNKMKEDFDLEKEEWDSQFTDDRGTKHFNEYFGDLEAGYIEEGRFDENHTTWEIEKCELY